MSRLNGHPVLQRVAILSFGAVGFMLIAQPRFARH